VYSKTYELHSFLSEAVLQMMEFLPYIIKPTQRTHKEVMILKYLQSCKDDLKFLNRVNHFDLSKGVLNFVICQVTFL